MKASLRTLLAGIVDYAGTFPPARLSLEETVRRYIEYRRGEHAWMLGKLVCSPQQLRELPSLCKSIGATDESAPISTSLVLAAADGFTFAASLLGEPDASALASQQEERRKLIQRFSSFGISLDQQAFLTKVQLHWQEETEADEKDQKTVRIQANLAEFEKSISGHLDIDSVEVRLTHDELACLSLAITIPELTIYLPLADGKASYFFESPSGDEWNRDTTLLLERLSEFQPEHLRQQVDANSPVMHVGFKLRTGGLEAAAFPSVERVAWVIAKCRDGRVPWKATAGLHHPLRHHDEKIGTMMHGFLNVTCAAVLADVHQLDEARIAEILRDESIESFEFRDDGLRWRNLEATNEQIAHCRKHGFLSFGSCSFEEPIEDLRALGLL